MLSDQFPGTCTFDAPACQVGPRTGHSRAPLRCRLERGGSLEATGVLVNSVLELSAPCWAISQNMSKCS